MLAIVKEFQTGAALLAVYVGIGLVVPAMLGLGIASTFGPRVAPMANLVHLDPYTTAAEKPPFSQRPIGSSASLRSVGSAASSHSTEDRQVPALLALRSPVAHEPVINQSVRCPLSWSSSAMVS